MCNTYGIHVFHASHTNTRNTPAIRVYVCVRARVWLNGVNIRCEWSPCDSHRTPRVCGPLTVNCKFTPLIHTTHSYHPSTRPIHTHASHQSFTPIIHTTDTQQNSHNSFTSTIHTHHSHHLFTNQPSHLTRAFTPLIHTADPHHSRIIVVFDVFAMYSPRCIHVFRRTIHVLKDNDENMCI